jgi:hypothetical protein
MRSAARAQDVSDHDNTVYFTEEAAFSYICTPLRMSVVNREDTSIVTGMLALDTMGGEDLLDEDVLHLAARNAQRATDSMGCRSLRALSASCRPPVCATACCDAAPGHAGCRHAAPSGNGRHA